VRLPGSVPGDRAVERDVHPVAVDRVGLTTTTSRGAAVGSGDQMTPSHGLKPAHKSAAAFSFNTFDMQRSFDHPALNELEARVTRSSTATIAVRRNCRSRFIGRYDLTQTAAFELQPTGLLFRSPSGASMGTESVASHITEFGTTVNAYTTDTERIVGETRRFEDIARVTSTRQKNARTASDSATRSPLHQRQPRRTRRTPSSLDRLMRDTGDDVFDGCRRLVFAKYAHRDITRPRAREVNWDRLLSRHLAWRIHHSRRVGPLKSSARPRVMWPVGGLLNGRHGGLFDSTRVTGQARVYHAEVVAGWIRRPVIVAASYGADFQRGDVRTSLLATKHVVRHLFQCV